MPDHLRASESVIEATLSSGSGAFLVLCCDFMTGLAFVLTTDDVFEILDGASCVCAYACGRCGARGENVKHAASTGVVSAACMA